MSGHRTTVRCESCLREFNDGILCQICQERLWRIGYIRELECRVKDLEKLCACYRTGKKPPDKLLDRIAKSKNVVHK